MPPPDATPRCRQDLRPPEMGYRANIPRFPGLNDRIFAFLVQLGCAAGGEFPKFRVLTEILREV